jgi:hypothetical protein
MRVRKTGQRGKLVNGEKAQKYQGMTLNKKSKNILDL